MNFLSSFRATLVAFTLGCISISSAFAEGTEEGWISLFDGTSLNGWKANESPETWKVEDGVLKAAGPVSHLFYVGEDGKASFVNFELKLEAKTAPNTNSGVFFRVPWQDSGWLQGGYEAQLQNSGKNKCYTGGLWIHADRPEPLPIKDGEWFEVHIIVQGDKVTLKINGEVTTEYDRSAPDAKGKARKLGELIALQGHGPTHRPEFRNIRIKPL